jgi:hypothetical protein
MRLAKLSGISLPVGFTLESAVFHCDSCGREWSIAGNVTRAFKTEIAPHWARCARITFTSRAGIPKPQPVK